RVLYALTDAGRAELRAWFSRPVERGIPQRDEPAIKQVAELRGSTSPSEARLLRLTQVRGSGE
ncbi:hypothetical protein TN53_26075, partial [Streptomyces sp. WM6386]